MDGTPVRCNASRVTVNRSHLGLERHSVRTAEGPWARVCQGICALNAVVWHNWLIGASVKRSLIAYDH